MSVGTPAQTIDVIPGGSWESPILGSTICSGSASGPSNCLADPTKLYNSSLSSTDVEIGESQTIVNSSFAPSIGAPSSLTGSAKYIFDTANFLCTDANTRSIPNFDMLVISEGHSTLPNGATYPLEVGYLSLGAQDANQSWNHGSGRFQGRMLSSYFWEAGEISSYSYGMHIGSPTVGLSGSLYLGGYDQSRVIGTVTYQPPGQNWLPIDLLDIGIGVAVGESPFNFTSKANLLVQNSSTINAPLSVTVEPRNPHLHLPQSTCDAIAEHLPVVFSPDLGLYLWNTNSTLYTRITTSPAVLTLTFRLSLSVTSNVTILVPFPLLALTLKPPMAPLPTGLKYFPCTPLPADATTPNDSPVAILGRAFLQAAFIGVNWSDQAGATWFMAQAPGPNTPGTASVEGISSEKTNIVASQNDWVQTWDGGWGVLEKDGTTASSASASRLVPTETGNGSGTRTPKAASLSTAAKAGAGIGAGVLALVVIASFLLWRKKRAKRDQQTNLSEPIQADHYNNEIAYGGFAPQELEGKHHGEQHRRLIAQELEGKHRQLIAQELEGKHRQLIAQELEGNHHGEQDRQLLAQELDGGGRTERIAESH